MTQALALIMAGGSNQNLSILTETRSEPAVPFGGKFRLVDFCLSNCVNSGIFNAAVLTQYRPRSLNDHIGIGKPWDLDRATGGVRLLQPYQGGPYGDWQKGSADAVRRNLDFVQQQQEEHVLILSGRHIYLMDYRPMLQHHVRNEAEITVAVRRVSPHETHRFGIVSTGTEDRIVRFQEKPKRSRSNLASMGIYVFRRDVLFELLQDESHIDFGQHILPAMIQNKRNVRAFSYPGYWADVGTVQAYWEANMGLLAEEPALDLYDPEWVVHTRSQERAPVKIGPRAIIDSALLSNGCHLEGQVERSVLSPGVYVAEGAVVKDSIILSDTRIGPGAVIDRCILDKGVVVGAEAIIGEGDDNTPNQANPEALNTGLTLIGRSSRIPEKLVVGRNVVIHPYSSENDFRRRKTVKSGSDIGADLR
jgi:glucose-1-phosphate adenylyltransferase